MKCPKCASDNTDSSKFCSNCGSSIGTGGGVDLGPTKTLETPIQGVAKDSLVAGKYRIIAEIGRGGMGIVYKAEDTKLRRTVALKFLPHQWTADAAARERFIHEARAASALDHPNICNIHEIEETDDGRMYISMACYEGESLREKINRGPLKTEEAAAIATQVAQGMSKAHQKGIVHRDLKPANILITNDGVAKIVDFGLAKLAGQIKLTREGTTVGTVAYMSPEQARGDAVDQRTDIWSLGVVLYEMLAGKLPFKGDFEQTLIHSILKTEPEPITKFRKDLPAGLAQIIAKALTKNPPARYQSMDELLEDLNAVAEGLKPLRAKTGFFAGRILGIKKTYAIYGFSIFIILIALALIFLFHKRGRVYDSLAVLPIVNLSNDAGRDFPTDALTGEIIQNLYMVGSLRIPRLQEVMEYKNTEKRTRQIGQELKVKAILSAELQFIGKTVRISARLIDAATERPIWAPPPYDREAEDIRALQMKIAQDIVREMRVKLTPQEQTLLSSSKTAEKKVIPQAYESYLKAKYILGTSLGDSPSRELWHTGFQHLQEAMNIDPEFAPAYWALVTFYYYMGNFFGFISYQDAAPKAAAALKKGLSLDPDSSEGHLAAGAWKMLAWDWEGSRVELERAVELNPSNPEAAMFYSVILQILGRFEEAINETRKQNNLNPRTGPRGLGMAYMNARRYDEAISNLRNALKIEPNDLPSHSMLALSFAQSGKPDEAVIEAEKSLALHPTSDKTLFHLYAATVYAYAGRTVDAKKLINEYLAFQKGKPIESFSIAEVYSVLGEKDDAFNWLERAYQEHANQMCWLKIDPPLDNIRSDPRYKEYLKKAGFEK